MGPELTDRIEPPYDALPSSPIYINPSDHEADFAHITSVVHVDAIDGAFMVTDHGVINNPSRPFPVVGSQIALYFKRIDGQSRLVYYHPFEN